MSSAKDSLIAKKYAEALAEVTISETVLAQLNMLQELLGDNNNLKSFLLNPSIKKESKAKLIKEVLAKNINPELINLLLILLERRRVNLIELLAPAYKEILNRKNNVQEANIISARAIDENELKELKTKLEKLFNQNITVNHDIDPALVAGLKIKVGNKVIDSSLEKKMQKLKNLMNI